jgi:hypothetical protein
MRTILSAIIIDGECEKHDYKSVFIKNAPEWYESKFDLKILKNCSNFLYELSKFKGVDCILSIGDVDTTELNNCSFEVRKKWVHIDEFNEDVITDVILNKKQDNINLILNYNLTYGGQVASCTPSKSILFVRDIDHILLEDSQYTCKMTTIGTSSVKTVFIVDYIDLDYGYIGGYYSIGISGPAYGGGSGYMMIRLGKNAYPLSPALKAVNNDSVSNAERVVGISNSINSSAKTKNKEPAVQVFPLNK